MKAYTTRVGSGPFPTELFDEKGDRLRTVGFEFGTTTGRPRRTGWYDAPITRYSQRINGVDRLRAHQARRAHRRSSASRSASPTTSTASGSTSVPVPQSDFHHAVPIYEEFPGWNEDISGAREFGDLRKNAQDYVLALEGMSGSRISAYRRRTRPRGDRDAPRPASWVASAT